jgi:hypothetical protein
MAQVNWVYLDDQGGRHRVGVYHGDRSGHLMIHANRRVMQIDFSVLDSKTYSFFIEDELCEVVVEKMKNGRFGYEFRVNKKIDTPRNRIRRVDNRRNNKLLAFFITGVVVVIALMFFGLKWYGKGQDTRRMSQTSIIHNLSKSNIKRLAVEGRSSTAYLHLEEINAKQVGVYTFKTADSTEIRGVFSVADTGSVILQNGFPLRTGDAFTLIYLPADPQVHRIELFQPTQPTISNYIALALAVEHRADTTVSKEKSLCRILTVAEWQNWIALADFIFQEKTPAQNPRHNRDTYLRLLRNPEVVKALEAGCWDK